MRLDEKTSSGDIIGEVIIKGGAFDILIMLYESPKSFIDLKNIGRSPNTTLARLRELQKNGLVQSNLFAVKEGKKPRIKYTLTDEGKELLEKYNPIKSNYLDLKHSIDALENRLFEQKQALKLLLMQIKTHK